MVKQQRVLFIDSANLEEIEKWNGTGIIDGVTTNQLIMFKDGIKPGQFKSVVRKICKEMRDKPVSVELSDSTASEKDMIKEAQRLDSLASNIVIKVPLIPDTMKSLSVISQLAKLDIAVNVTTLMTFEQMVLAALSTRNCTKPPYISLFWGRSIEDQAKYRTNSDFIKDHPKLGAPSPVNSSPDEIIQAMCKFLDNGGYDNPKIIVGSIRNAAMAGSAFTAGAHIVTVTPEVLTAMLYSQRTIETIKEFDEAWKKLTLKNN